MGARFEDKVSKVVKVFKVSKVARWGEWSAEGGMLVLTSAPPGVDLWFRFPFSPFRSFNLEIL